MKESRHTKAAFLSIKDRIKALETERGALRSQLETCKAAHMSNCLDADKLRSRNAELVQALRRAVGWVGATGNGKPVVDPRQLEDYNFARAVLAKAPT